MKQKTFFLVSQVFSFRQTSRNVADTTFLSLWRRQACPTLSKALDISTATAQVAPDLLKALAILSGTTARRSAVDWEDLYLYWKSEKGHISPDAQQ